MNNIVYVVSYTSILNDQGVGQTCIGAFHDVQTANRIATEAYEKAYDQLKSTILEEDTWIDIKKYAQAVIQTKTDWFSWNVIGTVLQ